MAADREHERLAALIPWSVTGQLDDDERRSLETHLEKCDSCGELLARAREQKELADCGEAGDHRAHVSPPLLTRFAEMPERLDPETRQWIESRLESCADCRGAYERLLEVEQSLRVEVDVDVEPQRRGLWTMLKESLLQPVPALAYLIALVAITAVWVADRPTGEVGGVPVTRTIRGEGVLRSDTGEKPAPLAISSQDPAVLLELETELEPGDLQDPELGLRLELRREGELLWSEPRAREEFAVREGKLVLPFLLNPQALRRGIVHELRLVAQKPGDPLDGSALFRRSLRVAP